ncbi:PhnD/SsuA/transferrin family substrate-binding protein [Pseudoxanthomonas sp. NC8]|nr:PhnD/SsuA/transferrin family substrate-binding protein [Pseudoxanthomonas sp. NC8]
MPVLLLASSVATAAGDGPWVVATYAYPARDRAAAIQPLADYLTDRSGHPVQVRVLASPTALVEALRDGTVDVAVPNLHGYLQARPGSEGIVALPVPAVPAAQADRYRAVIVARTEIDSIEVLQRQAAAQSRLMLVGRDSASGGFVPAGQLQVLGLDAGSAFASREYAGSHAAALQALVEGRADVAALAADVYDAARPAGVRELWRSDPIPPAPCCAAGRVRCRAMPSPAGCWRRTHGTRQSWRRCARAGPNSAMRCNSFHRRCPSDIVRRPRAVAGGAVRDRRGACRRR